VHAQVRQQRQGALHALTTRLVHEFDLIFIEDLNVKAMARGLHAGSRSKALGVAKSTLSRRPR
jgi:transposase